MWWFLLGVVVVLFVAWVLVEQGTGGGVSCRSLFGFIFVQKETESGIREEMRVFTGYFQWDFLYKGKWRSFLISQFLSTL